MKIGRPYLRGDDAGTVTRTYSLCTFRITNTQVVGFVGAAARYECAALPTELSRQPLFFNALDTDYSRPSFMDSIRNTRKLRSACALSVSLLPWQGVSMKRIPLSDEALDSTDESADQYLDDTDFDDHYDELDFEDEFDPYETDDPSVEDEQDYGLDL